MQREYYAMKLVIEAKGYLNYPEELQAVELKAEDRLLPEREKMDLARSMVLDSEYYTQKELIRSNMQQSLAELERISRTSQADSTVHMKKTLDRVRIIIVIFALGVITFIYLTTRLGINPVLKAVDRINEDRPVPVIGANEFRYLAQTYNKMYETYKKSLANLNYKASHDELTKVYNRAGYDLLMTSLDLKTTYMLLLDADHFKEINDEHGHEVGDFVLQKIAETIRSSFRSDDYVCRIGGDEFVVFMVHVDKKQQKLIEAKLDRINAELTKTDDGLPPVSISAGIVHGGDAETPQKLFEYADLALYETKRNGRNGFTFFGE